MHISHLSVEKRVISPISPRLTFRKILSLHLRAVAQQYGTVEALKAAVFGWVQIELTKVERTGTHSITIGPLNLKFKFVKNVDSFRNLPPLDHLALSGTQFHGIADRYLSHVFLLLFGKAFLQSALLPSLAPTDPMHFPCACLPVSNLERE